MRNARNLWTVLFWFLAGLPVAVAGTAIGVHVVGGGGGGGGSGTVGPGTVNTVAKFTAADTVDDSTITDDGSLVTVANALVCQKPADSTTAYQFKTSGGTTVLDVDTSNGRVGVGTTAPTTLLHIRKDQNAQTALAVENQTSNTAAEASIFALGGASGEYAAVTYASAGYTSTLQLADSAVFYGGSTTSKAQFGSYGGTVVFFTNLFPYVEAARFHTTANLSIGTTSDLAQIAVDNGADAEPIMVLRDNGTAVVTVADNGQIQSQSGSAGTPQYSFDGDTNTGMYRSSADLLSFSTNGVARLQLNTTGLTNADTSVTCGQLTGTVCVNDVLGVESSLSSGHAVVSVKATSTAGLSGIAAYDSGGTRRLDVGYGNSAHTVAASEAFIRTPGADALQFYNNTTKVLNIQADGYQWVATQGTKPSCSADSHVGRTVLYTKSAGATINPCVCQKVASTYGWAAMGAGGDCT